MISFPLPWWFLMQPPSDLHGLGHTARVMVWASILARDTDWFEPFGYPDPEGHSVSSVLIGWSSRKFPICLQYSGGSDLLKAVK